jgi:hypothetical protein
VSGSRRQLTVTLARCAGALATPPYELDPLRNKQCPEEVMTRDAHAQTRLKYRAGSFTIFDEYQIYRSNHAHGPWHSHPADFAMVEVWIPL